MEAHIDIRKLQLLNDRINQVSEALNQVRGSVRGLSHTAPMTPFYGSQGLPYGQPVQAMQQPMQPLAYGQQGYAQQLPITGLQHTAFPGLGIGQQPQVTYMPAFGLQHTAPFGVSGVPFAGVQALQPQWPVGLSHSEIERQISEVRACDPNRIARTFPNVLVSY